MIKDPTTTLEFLEEICRETIEHVFKKKLYFIQVDGFEYLRGFSGFNRGLMVSCIFDIYTEEEGKVFYNYQKRFIFEKIEDEYELVSMLDRKE